MSVTDPQPTDDRELVISRLIDAPRDAVFRCWTEPALIKQWFAPKPYETPAAVIDLRVGGENRITMRGPDGVDMPNVGVYLEVERPSRIVFTDAYSGGWAPSAKPFMTVVITLDEEAGKTRYTARARHWTTEDCEQHRQMGFHEGWGICTDQLAALAATL